MTREEKIDKLLELLEQQVEKRKQEEELHKEEHRYIRAQMEEAEFKRDFWRTQASRAVSASIWTVISVIFFSLAYTLKYHFFAK